MYTQIDKSKKNKNRAIANFVTQKKSDKKQVSRFVDNRVRTEKINTMQLKINTNINNKSIIQMENGVGYGILRNNLGGC